MYKIGELAEKNKVSIDTIRYYEKIGLIPKPDRKNKYRIYDESCVKQVGFIIKMEKLDFTLTEIGKLISITNLPASECITIRDYMLEKANEIDSKISELELLKEAVVDISNNCHEGYGISQCPIIEKLIKNS